MYPLTRVIKFTNCYDSLVVQYNGLVANVHTVVNLQIG